MQLSEQLKTAWAWARLIAAVTVLCWAGVVLLLAADHGIAAIDRAMGLMDGIRVYQPLHSIIEVHDERGQKR